jgi:hypothetical protein
MERCTYKAKIPFEIIVRGNQFIKDHPSVEVEDYLRALVVIYSSESFDTDLVSDELFGKVSSDNYFYPPATLINTHPKIIINL